MYFRKSLIGIALGGTSLFSFAQTIPSDFNQYCAGIFPIESCRSDSCDASNKLDTDMYLSCGQSYLELEEAMTKLPIGPRSFEIGNFGKANSYPVYTFRYSSLFNMPTKSATPIPYADMMKAKAVLDKNYDNFHKDNPFLKRAYDVYKPFDTPSKKEKYVNTLKQQKIFADSVIKAKNSVNFMLYNEQFYNLYLQTYKKFYPHAIYNGAIKDKKLSLYECQFINITEDFRKLQKENNFTCDSK